MKRQYSVAQLVFLSVLVGGMLALTAFMWQNALSEGQPKLGQSPKSQIPPAMGHWLKTGQDNWYKPRGVDLVKRFRLTTDAVGPSYKLEEARTALNRQLDAISVMYIWSDNDKLKVISITSFNKTTKQAAIIVIPLNTVVNSGNVVNLENEPVTIQDMYKEKGREAVRSFLESEIATDISNFVQVNQTALKKISDIIGGLTVNGDDITMLEAFEQTAVGIRTDDGDVVRAVSSQVLRPQMVLEVPNLLWIFAHDIKTNFSTEQMIRIFNISRQMDLGDMRKTALPGVEFSKDEAKYLFVSEQTWKNVVYEITQ